MDKTLELIFRAFNHIARELQIYCFSGFLILLNIYLICIYYYKEATVNFIGQPNFLLVAIIISYVLGHLCMALYYVIIELPGIDKKIDKLLKLSPNFDSTILPKLYKENKEEYLYFIERYDLLTMMRWTMSAAFFINFIFNTIILTLNSFSWQICALTIFSFISSIILLILTSKTENDFAERVESIKTITLFKKN